MTKTTANPKPAVHAPNAFIGKKEQPTDADLSAALGIAKPLWDHLVSTLMSDCLELVPEWKFYSLKMGWTFRLQHKKRNIIHFGPYAEGFQVMFIFGEKALRTVKAADLPKRIRGLIATAPKYPEGTGLRIEVTKHDVPAIRKLVKIKLDG